MDTQRSHRSDDRFHPTERPHTTAPGGTAGRDPVPTLRRLFQANGVFSLATGAVATVAAAPVANFLGLDQTWLVRAIGIGLLGFAFSLFVTAQRSPALLKVAAPAISAGDLGWVLATAAAIALGWLSTSGALVMAVVGVVVLVFGVEQFITGRRITL